jgi:hypothetical protein
MNDAVFYRKGIGDDDKAIENTNYFIKKFAKKQAGRRGGGVLQPGRDLREARRPRHASSPLPRYLKRYREGRRRQGHRRLRPHRPDPVGGELPGEDRRRLVHRSSVSARWRCAARASAARATPHPVRAAESKIKLTVVPATRPRSSRRWPRSPRRSPSSRAQGGKTLGGDQRFARYYYALAKFHQAEVDYEKFLAIKFPAGLDFDPAKPAVARRSLARFDAWYVAKDQASAALGARYAALVKQVGDPATAIAAAARFGQVQQHFADALYTAAVPAQLRPYEEAVDAYCGTLEERAAPHTDASLLGFEKCLQAATDFGWFSSWSALCERELGQLKPERFPTAGELRAAPDAAIAVADVEPAVARLE